MSADNRIRINELCACIYAYTYFGINKNAKKIIEYNYTKAIKQILKI